MNGEVKSAVWGHTSSGMAVNIYTLNNEKLTVQLTEYGARIVSVQAPDRNGKRTDVVLGYDSLAQYLENPETYFGAIGDTVTASRKEPSLWTEQHTRFHPTITEMLCTVGHAASAARFGKER